MSQQAIVKTAGAIALWAGALAAMHGWAGRLDHAEYMSVPPAATARSLGAGFDNVLADGYYLQFVTYFGKHLMRDRQYHNVEPVLALLTDLDPHFEPAYVLGALALGDNGHLSAAEALLAKGVDRNPQDWHMAYDAGMNIYLFGNTPAAYMSAGHFFHLAAAHPEAPPEAHFMEARMADISNRGELAKRIWLQTYRTTPSRETREVARRALLRLHVPLPDRR